MRLVMSTIVAVLMATAGASAQSVQIGPGGVRLDPRSPAERAIDRDIREERRGRVYRREVRRNYRDDCRTTRITERDRFGNRVTRVVERC